ncbi:MAG: alpha/beta fold hydrolase [Pseudomonadota bacterium]
MTLSENSRSTKHSGVWARILCAVFGSVLIGFSLFSLKRADAGLNVERLTVGSTPVTIYRRAGNAIEPAPVVLICHGFAGSQQLMEAFAASVSKSGYTAVSFDYLGHGRNLEPLRGDVTKIDGATTYLLEQTRQIADFALGLPDADGRLAMLGHSMASDIIVRFAQRDSRVGATIAVSMFSPAVDESSPKNLLMLVGSLEAYLKQEALRVLGLLTDAPAVGVTFHSLEAGDRRVAVAPMVEHVGVLYSRTSMNEAVNWLKRILPLADDENASPHLDGRGPFILLLLLGLIVLAWPLAGLLPTVCATPAGASLPWRRLISVALIPAVGTPVLLAGFPADFLGVLVGGYLAVHFAVYGILGAVALWWTGRGVSLHRSKIRWSSMTVAVLASCAFSTGLIVWFLDQYVTSMAVVPMRYLLVLLMLVGTLCYFLADEWIAHGQHSARGGHLFTRLCFLFSLLLAVAFSFEELFFLAIIAGVIIVYFFVYGFFSRWIYQQTGHPAVGAVGNAVAFAWTLAAVFPVMTP